MLAASDVRRLTRSSRRIRTVATLVDVPAGAAVLIEGPRIPVGPGSSRSVLIAEGLLLLLTDDTSGSTPAVAVEILLAGANLVELALIGRVDDLT